MHAKPGLGHNLSDLIADLRLPRWLPSGNLPRPYLPALKHAVRGQFKDLRITTAQADGPADEALGPKLSWGFSGNAVMTKASWTGLASRR